MNRDAWRRVAAVFVPRAKDAQTERRWLAHWPPDLPASEAPVRGHIVTKLSCPTSATRPNSTVPTPRAVKTAKTLGLTIPAGVLFITDEVIE